MSPFYTLCAFWGGCFGNHLCSRRVWEGQRGFSGIDSPSLEAQFGKVSRRGLPRVALLPFLCLPACVLAKRDGACCSLGPSKRLVSVSGSPWVDLQRGGKGGLPFPSEYHSLASPSNSAYILKSRLAPDTLSPAELRGSPPPYRPRVERVRDFSFSCLPRVSKSGAFTEETPVAIYHDQCKALQAVVVLSIGCSECGITRERSIGPEFLAFFAGLSWSKLWPHRCRSSSWM